MTDLLSAHFTSQRRLCSGVNVNAYLFLRKSDMVLLHYRMNTGYCDNSYGIISGHVEEGESATAAIIREAYEEAGIRLKEERLKVVHIMHRKTNRLNVDIFFECDDWEGEIHNREPEKCGGLNFFSIHELPAHTIDYISLTLQKIADGIFYSEKGWEERTKI